MLMYEYEGETVERSPSVWFTAEFLSSMEQFTEVNWVSDVIWQSDWKNVYCLVARNYRDTEPCMGRCLKGLRVLRHEHQAPTVIWLLTGEYNWELNMFEGRWPD